MTTRDLFSEVMRNLGRRKLRTGLTMAGVVMSQNQESRSGAPDWTACHQAPC